MAGIDLTAVLLSFFVLIVSLTVHEAAHAWSADLLGDPTAKALGRVSLNPAVHVDPIGTILFPLVAMFTGVPLLGWAKPVPVDPRHLGPHWKQKFMAIAAAGPASNLVLATLAGIAFLVMTAQGAAYSIAPQVLFMAVRLNVLLAVFNMIPVPPLDGGNVLAGVLRGPAADAFDRLRPYGFLLLYVVILSGALNALMTPIERWIASVLLY